MGRGGRSGVGGPQGEAVSARTLADWRAALEAAGWRAARKSAREWCGPCPLCGGRDRFHVARGRRVEVIAGCRRCGADFGALARAVFGEPEGPTFRAGRMIDPETARERSARNARRAPRSAPRPGSAPEAGKRPERPVPGRFRAFPGDPPENGPPESPVSARNGGPRPPVPPESGGFADREAVARRLWERSGAVPSDPAHPARRWAARRSLWPEGAPWPDAIRWLPGPEGGSLVAAFAPVSVRPAPSAVQLLHVAPDGRPRTDRGGLAKRSRGRMAGAVCVIGPPRARDPARHQGSRRRSRRGRRVLPTGVTYAARLHVAEGIADALAVASRTGDAALAAGGASGFARLAGPLAAVGVPVVVWPDGDPPGRRAAEALAEGVRARGGLAAVARVPDGEDPASLFGTRKPVSRNR